MKSIKKKKTIKNLKQKFLVATTVFQLCSTPGMVMANNNVSQFHGSSYTYCDATILASFWGNSVYETKARVGMKISNGDYSAINSFLKDARPVASKKGVQCNFYENGYSYDDAELLAGFWKIGISEAKTMIDDKLFYGDNKLLAGILEDAKKAKKKVPVKEMSEKDRFFDSDYTYCDATLLSSLWKDSMSETKARIGRKIGWGDFSVMEDYLSEARTHAKKKGITCNYYDSGYEYDDAELLGAFWDVDTSEAKAMIGDKLFNGDNKILKEILADMRAANMHHEGPGEEELYYDAYFNSNYTYCDVRILSKFWEQSEDETKIMIGEKLDIGGESFLEAALGQGRTVAKKKGVSCDFWDSGYEYSDAEVLAGIWKVGISEAKSMVGDKLFRGENKVMRKLIADAKKEKAVKKEKPVEKKKLIKKEKK